MRGGIVAVAKWNEPIRARSGRFRKESGPLATAVDTTGVAKTIAPTENDRIAAWWQVVDNNAILVRWMGSVPDGLASWLVSSRSIVAVGSSKVSTTAHTDSNGSWVEMIAIKIQETHQKRPAVTI